MIRMGQDSCALVLGSSDALSRLRARLHCKHDSRRNRGMPVAAGAPCVRGRRPGAEPCGHNSPAHLYKPHTEPSQSGHAHSGSGMSCCVFPAYDTPMLRPSLVQDGRLTTVCLLGKEHAGDPHVPPTDRPVQRTVALPLPIHACPVLEQRTHHLLLHTRTRGTNINRLATSDGTSSVIGLGREAGTQSHPRSASLTSCPSVAANTKAESPCLLTASTSAPHCSSSSSTFTWPSLAAVITPGAGTRGKARVIITVHGKV